MGAMSAGSLHPSAWSRRTVIAVSAITAVVGAMLGIGVAMLITGSADHGSAATPTAPTTTSGSPSPSAPPSPTPTAAPPTVDFTVVAAGDILTHMPVIWSAQTDAGLDFTPLLSPLRPYVEGADLALCHLEFPVDTSGNYTGYPMFGGPAEMITDLRGEGWDGCSTASNHSVDRGYSGVEATIAALDAEGMGFAGTARTEAESLVPQMYSVTTQGRTLTVASISATYGLNGLPQPDGKPWAVTTFDADSADATPIIAAARSARELGADIVIASTHCCVEYQVAPTDAQRAIVEAIAASGTVDLYVGHHAHVPQPIELIEGGPSGQGMWAAFGLGNFLSNQDEACCGIATGVGVLLSATFSVPPEGPATVDVAWTATTVDRRDSHTMHALRDIMSTGTDTLTTAQVQERWQVVADAVGPQAPELSEPVVALADDVTVVPRTPSSQQDN